MLSLFRTLSLRYLWKHWPRSALVVASIALGVATWVATDALSRALDRSLRQAATPLGTADLYVTNAAALFVDASLAPQVQKVPGVKRVEPIVLETVSAALTPDDLAAPDQPGRENDGRKSAMLLGLRWPMQGGKSDELAERGIQVTDLDFLKVPPGIK